MAWYPEHIWTKIGTEITSTDTRIFQGPDSQATSVVGLEILFNFYAKSLCVFLRTLWMRYQQRTEVRIRSSGTEAINGVRCSVGSGT